MKKIKLLFCFSFVRHSRLIATAGLFIFSFSFSYGQSWLWGRQGHSAVKAWSEGMYVTQDSAHNPVLTGFFYDTLTFGSTLLYGGSNIGGATIYIAKYDRNGNFMWAHQGITANLYNCLPYAIAADGEGNVFITGIFTEQITFGAFTLTPLIPNTNNMFLVKYDYYGNVVWAVQSNVHSGRSNCDGNALAADKQGNIFVGGSYTDTLWLGSNTLVTSYHSYQMFLAKYSPVGNLLKLQTATRGHSNSINSLAIDVDNNLYAGGLFVDSLTLGTWSDSTRYSDVFISKMDSSGKFIWTTRSHSKNSMNILSYNPWQLLNIAVDESKNVIVTGSFADSVTFGTTTLIGNTFMPTPDIYLVKYDLNGNFLWAEQGNPNFGEATGCNVAADIDRNIYLTGGMFMGAQEISFNSDTLKPTSHGGDPAFIAKFDSNGTMICGTILPTGGDDENGFSMDPQAKYIYFGSDMLSTTSLILGNDTLKSPNNEDAFVARWQPCNSIETSINELKTKSIELTVFPNPFSTITTIVISQDGKHALELYDLTGQKLKSISFIGNTYTLSAEGLVKGMYFIRILDKEKNVVGTSKIVVQ